MRKVIMMFALAMGIVTVHAQENVTVAEENNGSKQQTDAQPVLRRRSIRRRRRTATCITV